jgi:hypothetical protein
MVAADDEDGRQTRIRGDVVDTATSDELFAQLRARTGRPGPVRREPMRRWELSGVERVHFADGATVVFKYADRPFEREAAILAHVACHGVPVPELIASIQWADAVGMLLEDLGAPTREATATDAARVAVAIHAATPVPGLPVLDGPALAELPQVGLAALTTLRRRGRWVDTDDVRDGLASLEGLVSQRGAGAELAPFGLCHSEFHPTSIHIGPTGVRVLDFARAFTGPGLLDLASWTHTANPPDLPALRELLTAYVAAGGAPEAFADRGGLPAERWAYGMHRLWIIIWYLQQQTTWINNPALDHTYQHVVRRHLAEARQCLT